MTQSLQYHLHLAWEGRPDDRYAHYGRAYRLRFDGKHDIVGSADPTFGGDRRLHNPEELLVASVASCHMLTYLALATHRRLGVSVYEDEPQGSLEVDGRGRGRLTIVRLRPRVTIRPGAEPALAAALHREAHERCFIAQAVSARIEIEPEVTVAEGPGSRFEDPDASLRDLSVVLDDAPGALAAFAETLGAAGVNLEGGGAWTVDGRGRAHFLVRTSEEAVHALAAAGLEVEMRPVIIQRLAQGVPGQLGDLSRHLARAGVNVEVVYSDHDHRLVMVVDDWRKGARASADWRTSGSAPAPSR